MTPAIDYTYQDALRRFRTDELSDFPELQADAGMETAFRCGFVYAAEMLERALRRHGVGFAKNVLTKIADEIDQLP